MKMLCSGDLHIGRRSSRVPPSLDGPRYSCSASWEMVVDCALDQRVDLVALSGDIADRSNRYFEAFGPLERGIRRLSEAGIITYAIAGNHDFDVLPRLVDAVGSDHLHLLGAGGHWERVTIERDGAPRLHIDGWSFPQEHVPASPMASYAPPPTLPNQGQGQDQVPVLGMVHGDLEQPRSRYGPLALPDLRRQSVSMWLLGHIHGARLVTAPGDPLILYPGSPQAMDPGEDGRHGPWIIEFQGRQPLAPRQILTSTVQYCAIEVDLSEVDELDQVERRIAEAVRAELNHLVDSGPGPLECLCCRIVLTGRTSLHRRLPAVLQPVYADLSVTVGAVCASVEKIVYQTAPSFDLDTLARRSDPPGELARLLLDLSSGEPSARYQPLLSATADRLRDVHLSRSFDLVGADPTPEPDAARHYLYREGLSLLDALLAQKEST